MSLYALNVLVALEWVLEGFDSWVSFLKVTYPQGLLGGLLLLT